MRLQIVTTVFAFALVAAGAPAAPDASAPGDRDRAAIAAATAELEQRAPALRVDAAGIRFTSVRHSLIGTHVRGAEYRGGIKVDGTYAAVHTVARSDGSTLVSVEAWDHDDIAGTPVATPIGEAAALTSADRLAGIAGPTTSRRIERLLVPHGGALVDTYRVTLLATTPAYAGTLDLAAADGTLLAARDDRQFASGFARLFDPNPTVRLRDSSLRTPGVDESGIDTDLDSDKLTAARSMMQINQVDATQLYAGRLVGPWVDVQGPASLGTSPNFDLTRSDPRFEALMAYAHIDRFQRYLQSLGFVGDAAVNAEPQNVIAVPVMGFDNAFYQPGNDLLLFGAGGVDDGEDAEVILHEYGHAMQDAQVRGWGATAEGGAMGEGFGDFIAAAYFAAFASGGFQDECVADWDATSYSSDDPPCLRRTDSTKRYPRDIENQVHADGELWSAFLWRLRARLVTADEDRDLSDAAVRALLSERSIQLVVTSQELLAPDAEFAQAIAALRVAADALGHPEWDTLIDATARETKMPRGG